MMKFRYVLNNKLMKLDDDVVVYSGHGYKTSIGFERNNNPYVKGDNMITQAPRARQKIGLEEILR